GVIVAVTTAVSPGGISGTVSWSNVTSQPLGGVARMLTAVRGAVPVLTTSRARSLELPTVTSALRRWSAVDRSIEYEPTTATISAVDTSWPPSAVAVTVIGYSPASALGGDVASTVMFSEEPASTASVVAPSSEAGRAST